MVSGQREVVALRMKIKEYEKMFEQISSLPNQLANVVRTYKHDDKWFATLSNPSGILVEAKIDRELADKLELGDYVAQTANGSVHGAVENIANFGLSATVKRVVAEDAVEIEGLNGAQIVVAWSEARFPDVKAGAQVMVDRGMNVIVGTLRSSESQEYAFESDTGVSWDDIGGLDDAKKALISAVELPLKHPELFTAYKRKPVRGILLEGPPRCGKTMLAKAVATSLKTIGKSGGAFFYVKGPAVLDKLIGVAEGRIRGIFAAARKHKKETGEPAVIFMDEADALLSARGSTPHSYIDRTMVPTVLAEMDGLEESGAIVILATNLASQLDPAILGHGRIDRTIYVPRPTQTIAETIFELALRTTFVRDGSKRVAARAAEELFAEAQVVRELEIPSGKVVLRLRDVVNGAMITAAVAMASDLAMARDLAGDGKPTGITPGDISAAISTIKAEESHKNHNAAFMERINAMPTTPAPVAPPESS